MCVGVNPSPWHPAPALVVGQATLRARGKHIHGTKHTFSLGWRGVESHIWSSDRVNLSSASTAPSLIRPLSGHRVNTSTGHSCCDLCPISGAFSIFCPWVSFVFHSPVSRSSPQPHCFPGTVLKLTLPCLGARLLSDSSDWIPYFVSITHSWPLNLFLFLNPHPGIFFH